MTSVSLALLPLFVVKAASMPLGSAEQLIDGGVKGIELTYSTPDCCAAIKEVVSWNEPGVGVGVGTVRTVDQLNEAVRCRCNLRGLSAFQRCNL